MDELKSDMWKIIYMYMAHLIFIKSLNIEFCEEKKLLQINLPRSLLGDIYFRA